MSSITYIGSTLSLSAGAPMDAGSISEAVSVYRAKSWTEIGNIISFAAFSDTFEDVTIDLLKLGRRKHVNGVRDIGDVELQCELNTGDTGQSILRTNANTNTTYSFRVSDADGHERYFYGVISNQRDMERTASSFKGVNFTLRGQSAIVDDLPPAIITDVDSLTIEEGLTGGQRFRLRVRLSAEPSANVVVTATTPTNPGNVLTLTGSPVTLTTANYRTGANSIRIGTAAVSGSDPVEASILLMAGNTGGYNGITKLIPVTVTQSA